MKQADEQFGIGGHSWLNALACLVVVWGAGVVQAHESETWILGAHGAENHGEWSVNGAWESRYFAEGRDQLDGHGFWHNSLEWSGGPLVTGLWYAHSPEASHEELQLSGALTGKVGIFDAYVGYTHLRFPADETHDHEVGAGLAWHEGPLDLEFAVDAYHSFDAEGYFVETTVARSWDVVEGTAIELATLFGVNQGYVPDGHDGANHVALRLGISQDLGDALTVHLHGTWSWAIDRREDLAGDEALKDMQHAGVSLELKF